MAVSRVSRYALADYQLVISLPEQLNNSSLLQRSGLTTDKPFVIGGPGETGIEGSYVGQITVKRNKELWTTEGDATGSWVHSKNLDRTGEIDVDITQVSDQVIVLAYLCDAFETIQEAIGGLNIQVLNAATQETVAEAVDCYIKKIPDHAFKDTADKLTWTFTCGRVMWYI